MIRRYRAEVVPNANSMTDEEREEKKDALRRYEEIRRDHLGAAINLIFGLSSAAVGFCLLRITDKDSVFTRPGSCFFVLATLTFITTVAICITSTWTRLRDFRLTVRRVRRKLRGADDAELKRLHETTKRLGKWTWRLFYLQLATFGLGVVLLTIALSLLYKEHVFPKPPVPKRALQPTAAAHGGDFGEQL